MIKVKSQKTGRELMSRHSLKRGDKSKAVNYRPVSLMSTCCKIMEHIAHSHLMNFLESNNILSDFKHGRQKKRSCETQLLVTVHDLAARLDRHQQIDAILLDFSKAFNKVPHQALLPSSITMELETRPYRGSIASSKIGASK